MVGNATGSVKSSTLAKGITLKQNAPNPFSSQTQIGFHMERSGYGMLQVVDMTGRVIADIHDGSLPGGDHSFTFEADQLSHGTYFYHLDVNGTKLTRSMAVVK